MYTADMRRKEPRRVPRPGGQGEDDGPSLVTGAGDKVVARGFAGMLALAAKQRGLDPAEVAGIADGVE